jgi:hypothetical protein
MDLKYEDVAFASEYIATTLPILLNGDPTGSVDNELFLGFNTSVRTFCGE